MVKRKLPVLPSDLEYLKEVENARTRSRSARSAEPRLVDTGGVVRLAGHEEGPMEIEYAIDSILNQQWISEIGNKKLGARVAEFRRQVPALVLVSHLYGVFPMNATFVDRQVRAANDEGKVIVVVVGGMDAVIKRLDYCRMLARGVAQDSTGSLETFYKMIGSGPMRPVLSKEDLLDGGVCCESEVVASGFLTLSGVGNGQFKISVPNTGVFVRVVRFGRKWVAKVLGGRPFKELTESRLTVLWTSPRAVWRELGGVSLMWVLKDCCGSGICEPFNTPVGVAWRLL